MFSGSDGLVDDHTSKHESRASGMWSGCVRLVPKSLLQAILEWRSAKTQTQQLR